MTKSLLRYVTLLTCLVVSLFVISCAGSSGNSNDLNPSVKLLTPNNGASDVTLDPSIQVQFSKEVRNVNQTTVSLLKASESGESAAISDPVAGDNNTYSFSPQAELQANTTYYLIFDSNITDNAGHHLARTVFSFTTGTSSAPSVNLLYPGNNAKDVIRKPNIQIQFNEEVTGVNHNSISLHLESANGASVPLGPIVAGDQNIYSFSPTNLLPENTDIILVINSEIKDLAGNPLPTTTFKFTTGGHIKPIVHILQPVDNASDVSRNPQIIVKFNEEVTNVTSSTFTLHQGSPSGSLIETTEPKAGEANTYSISPAAELDPNSLYYVVLSSDIHSNVNDDNLDDTNFHFTTGTKSTPIVSIIKPANNSNNVSRDTEITIQFSEKVLHVDSNSFTLHETDATGAVIDAELETATDNTYTLHPNDELKFDTTYAVVTSDAITDVDGNPLKPTTFYFHTQSQASFTWQSGSDTVRETGNYGSIGVEAADNHPGGRQNSASWHTNNYLWIFGGYGLSQSTVGTLNDIWKYNLTTKQWSWVSGSQSPAAHAQYGTKGVIDANNNPGSRTAMASWQDQDGNFWLFGGSTSPNPHPTSIAVFSDLWKYDTTQNQWVWVHGDDDPGQPGHYGTKDVADELNKPGARIFSNSWVDTNGKFWLFGGYGQANTDKLGYLDDVWLYQPDSNEWTWVAGSNQVGTAAKYGTKDVASPSNTPGGRAFASSWRDLDGNLWLLGGSLDPVGGTNNLLNDLWKFDISTKQWTWVAGDQKTNEIGHYGQKQQPTAETRPGARVNGTTWVDSAGNLWLFGGFGYDSNGQKNLLNDLWKFNPTTKQWTWVAGSTTVLASGNYGSKGTTAPTSFSGSRNNSASLIDSNGNWWLFGGYAVDSQGQNGFINDLWQIKIDQ